LSGREYQDSDRKRQEHKSKR